MKIERKKNEEIKGWISSSSLIPVYTIHLPTVQVCTKFESSRPHSSWEKCDEKFQCLKIGEKEKWKNKGMNKCSSMIAVYTIHLCVPSFNLLGLTVPEKSVTKIFNVWKLEKNENIKRWIRAAAWFRYTRYIHPFSTCVTSFKLLGLTVPEESLTKNFHVWKLERKKKWRIKGQISSSSLILVYTIHLYNVHMCTKFQPSRPHSSWEKCDKKFQC